MLEPKISKEEVNKLPVRHFEGKIILIETTEQAEKALLELNKEEVVGIDTETRPSFKRGVVYKVSLMQIATEDTAYLFRLNKIGFPDALLDFLANENILKIGLSLRDDFNGLSKQRRQFKPAGFVDIQNIVKQYGVLELSLQKVFAILFAEKISKSQQLTNWEKNELTEPQKRYAATDAWATLRIYKRIIKEKKLSKWEISQLEEAYSTH